MLEYNCQSVVAQHNKNGSIEGVNDTYNYGVNDDITNFSLKIQKGNRDTLTEQEKRIEQDNNEMLPGEIFNILKKDLVIR